MSRNYRTLPFVLFVAALAALSGKALANGDSHGQILTSETVWQPEVEELEWSEVRPAEIDKSWLDSDYSDQDFIVARGISGATKRQAIEEHILPRLEKRLHLQNDRHRRIAVRGIQRELKRVPVIVDQFEQTFFKQAGDEQMEAFTREALLLDVSRENLAKLIRPVRHDLHRSEDVRSGALTFAIVAMGIVCFTCWIGSRFFNRLTQGYYVWPIRLVTATVLLGAFGLAARITFSILRAL